MHNLSFHDWSPMWISWPRDAAGNVDAKAFPPLTICSDTDQTRVPDSGEGDRVRRVVYNSPSVNSALLAEVQGAVVEGSVDTPRWLFGRKFCAAAADELLRLVAADKHGAEVAWFAKHGHELT